MMYNIFWCMTANILSFSLPPSPSAQLLDKLMRKFGCLLVRKWNHTCTSLCTGALMPTSPSDHHKKSHANLLSLFLQDIFRPAWEDCLAHPRKPHYVSNNPFHTLLWCVISLDILVKISFFLEEGYPTSFFGVATTHRCWLELNRTKFPWRNGWV